MAGYLRPLSLCCALLSAGGCATIESVPYNKEANAHISEVVVLAMPEREIDHRVFNNPAESFGLIGGLMSAASEASRQNALQAKIGDFQIVPYFQESLEQALTARGYTVVWDEPRVHERVVSAPDSDPRTVRPLRERDHNAMRRRYVAVDEVHAQLDVGLSFVGLAAAGVGKASPYRPTVLANVRLLEADGETVLFEDQFAYHNVLGNEQTLTLEPNAAYAYVKFEELEALDDAQVVAMLREAMDAMTSHIAAQL